MNMKYRRSKVFYGIAFLGLTFLAPGVTRALDFDDVEYDLSQARSDRAQAELNRARAEADLRSIEATRAAQAARKSADDAAFARFEAESRATEAEQARLRAEGSAKKTTYISRIGPTGTRYVERRESTSSPSGYVEEYQEVQQRTTFH